MFGNFLFNKAVAAGTLQNRTGITSIAGLAESFGKFLFEIGLFLGVVAALWAGVLFLTAGGNAERIEKGRKAIWWAVIGIIIMLIGQGIIVTIKNFLGT